jgi:hypothetical protein
MQTPNKNQSSVPVMPVPQQQAASPFKAAVVPNMPTIPAPVEYAAPQAAMAEGGLLQEGGSVDPVSGNEVPTGSLKEEVRDDIPAKLSEGEFVFPADVVRFIGLERLMQLRQEAKDGLAKMEAMGQMGNADEATMDDSGEFETDIDDIIRDVEQDEAYEMYVGGVVKKKYANGGLASSTPSVDAQMNAGAMTAPAMTTEDIFRKEIQTDPAKEPEVKAALEAMASNRAAIVRENNSLFVISGVTPGIVRMEAFSADTPEMMTKSVAEAIPLLRASKVNGVEIPAAKQEVVAGFEAAGFKPIQKDEATFVVDLTKRV